MAGTKASDIETIIRVNQICQMMVKGITRTNDIISNIVRMNNLPEEKRKKAGWIVIDKCERQIKNLIAKAKETFKKAAQEDISATKALVLAQLNDMFAEARREKKLNVAANILRQIIFVEGLGSVNVKGSFDIGNFDVKLSEQEEAEYKKRMEGFYGKNK